MRVTSPIGDLPFTVRGAHVEGRELVVEGSLGAWRSTVRLSAADAPMLARAFARPLAVAGMGAAALVLLTRRRS